MLDANNYVGTMLDERYRLIRVIGHGVSSAVFYAEDMLQRRDNGTPLPVAVKIFDRESPEYRQNFKGFESEIRKVAGIPTNPHIVAVKDASFEDEHFIVMEYVSGKTLRQYMKEKAGPLSVKEIVSIALQTLQALRFAHGVGVVHRDIKPQNIILERADAVGKAVDVPGGEGMPYVKVADFGITMLPSEDMFPAEDRGVGTVHYITPEQAAGREPDARSDLYSLGVVMYEMATGKVPFDAGSPAGIMHKHQTEIPFHVGSLNNTIPKELDEVIFTAMQKSAALRYTDALDMERALRGVLRVLEPSAQSAEDGFREASIAMGAESAKVRPPKPPREKPVRVKPAPAERPQGAEPRERAARAPLSRSMKMTILGAASGLAVIALVLCLIFLLPSDDGLADIRVPNLVGMTYAEGTAYGDGIVIGNVEYVYDDNAAAGKILSHEPSAGVLCEGVAEVSLSLKVSRGPETVTFTLPAAHRVSFDAAKQYLQGQHIYLHVDGWENAPAVVGDAPTGTVIGARRVGTGEMLSLDGDSVYKNKAENIVLIIQPEPPAEYEEIGYSLLQLENYDVAKALIESEYSYISVVNRETVTVPPFDLVMDGNVVGFRIVGGDTVMMQGINLQTSVVKDKPIEIVLLVYSAPETPQQPNA